MLAVAFEFIVILASITIYIANLTTKRVTLGRMHLHNKHFFLALMVSKDSRCHHFSSHWVLISMLCVYNGGWLDDH